MKRDAEYSYSSNMDEKILKKAAELAEMEGLQELSKYEGREPKGSYERNEQLLNMAKEIDYFRKKDKRKHRWKSLYRVAAVLLICCISIGGLTIESSQGFRKKIFNQLFNNEQGGVTLTKDDEELLSGWKEYWYPAYLPHGMKLIYAEVDEHFLAFEDGKGNILRIFEIGESASMSFDTDTQEMEKEKIGFCEGYYFSDKENNRYSLFFSINEDTNIYIRYEGTINKEELIKIAENMEFIKQ